MITLWFKKLFKSEKHISMFFVLVLLIGCARGQKPKLTGVDTTKMNEELAELKDTVFKQNKEITEMREKFNRENDKLRSDLKVCRNENEAMKQKYTLDEEELGKMQIKSSLFEELNKNLSEEIKMNQITISELRGKLTVDILNHVLFEKGSADISEDGINILKKVSDALKKAQDKDIRIEGHTDSDPIWSKKLRRKYDSNWELSTTRATNILRVLVEKNGIDPKKIYAAGYGEFRPVVSNETSEGKAKNRRIDIVLVSR